MRQQWSDAFINWMIGLGVPDLLAAILAYAIGGFVLVFVSLNSALLLIWITRKVISRIQDRIGPNRVGPFGLMQTPADALKLMSKEDIMPSEADAIAYNLSPVLAVFGMIMLWAVIPFAPGFIGVDLNVGILYIVALGSVAVMAALMAGWGSNNKYALLAGFRVVAQLLSYEIPMVLAVLTVVLLTGTMRLAGIVEFQALSFFGFNIGLGWLGVLMPGAMLVFFISTLAEAELTPFDLLEAESELIAGFHIEYSGMKFAMFFLAQFVNAWIWCALITALFLGGWQGPFVDQLPILGLVYFFAKAYFVYVLQQWVRGTFPRVRIDQMMYFAWKVLVPLMVGLIVVQAIVQKLPVPLAIQYVLIFAANIGLVAIVVRTLNSYFRSQGLATKRSFQPRSLIGTMQPAE
ncbi:MAG: NADH-quinone oxidoreductase subunit H [Caldilineaceae bacterium]|nr:NADH-quinone oxidoreductase subunit H [Caldilineaceae bacterium]